MNQANSGEASETAPTLPNPLQMSLSGFENGEAVRKFAETLRAYLHVIGSHLNLELLDAVTAAFRRDGTLAAR